MIQAFFSGVSFALGFLVGMVAILVFMMLAARALESFASELEQNFREMEEVELEVENR